MSLFLFMQRVITFILLAVDTSIPTHGQNIPSAVAAPILITLLLIVVVIVLFIGRKRFYVLCLVISFFFISLFCLSINVIYSLSSSPMTYYVYFHNSFAKLFNMCFKFYFRCQSKQRNIGTTNLEWQGNRTESNALSKYDICI